VDVKLIVLGSHLSHEFGTTVSEIESDGFPIAARVECLLSSDTDVGMAKTIGVALLSLSDILSQLRPDLLLLIADRYEILAPASVALALRIPIAHIEGGEVSEGAIDDAVRNALRKLSHIHFTATFAARERVIALGEEAWRVHRTGAPSLERAHAFAASRPAESAKKSILDGLRVARSDRFRESLVGLINPYGDGFASERIVDILTAVPLSQELLMKRHVATHDLDQNRSAIEG
jgi:UDP-N-acetylglucosamine 2-epimerase